MLLFFCEIVCVWHAVRGTKTGGGGGWRKGHPVLGAKGGESDFFSLSPSSHDWLCVAHGALRGERHRLPVSNEDEAVVKKTTNQNPKEEEDSFFSWRRLWVFWFLEMH